MRAGPLSQAAFNSTGVIIVNPARHPHVKKELGQALRPNADDPSA
jgi:hypothetical protein